MADPADERRLRRRIDRVTAEDYLADLQQRTPAELRAMRDDCREEEGRLSYARRLLQGRLDILRAEVARRAGQEQDLIDALPGILADRVRGETDAAHAINSPVHDFPDVGGRGEESLIHDASIGRITELDDDEVAELRTRLEDEERRVSGLRRTVLDHLDGLQDELVERYRTGSADVREVVAKATAQPPTGPRGEEQGDDV